MQIEGRYHLIMHGPPLPLSAVPAGVQYVFTVREARRGVSGFNGRKHKSGHEEQPLAADEVPICERFAEPNELAEALYSSNPTDRDAAEHAMKRFGISSRVGRSSGAKDMFLVDEKTCS